MKENRTNFITIFGFVALALSIFFFTKPDSVKAAGGDKQWVSEVCTEDGKTWSCNNCNPGSRICGDNTCDQCKPADPEQ